MASMIVTFPTVWAHLIGQLLYYMGDENIVFGSDSLWYGGPQWQIDALWRFQIPEDLRRRWHYPELTPGGEAEHPRPEQRPALWPEDVVAQEPLRPGQAGGLRGPYAVGERHRHQLERVGYPTPVTPVPTKDDDDDKDSSLLRDDNLTKVKKQYADDGRRPGPTPGSAGCARRSSARRSGRFARSA